MSPVHSSSCYPSYASSKCLESDEESTVYSVQAQPLPTNNLASDNIKIDLDRPTQQEFEESSKIVSVFNCTLILSWIRALCHFCLCGRYDPKSVEVQTEEVDEMKDEPTPPTSSCLACLRNTFLGDFLEELVEEEANRESKHSSISCDSMSRRCLCDTIYPIIKLSQFTGIIPLSIKHTRNSEGRKVGDCQLLYKWKCVGTVSNSILMILFLIALPFAYAEIWTSYSKLYTGTDLYAFTFQSLAMVIQTTVILISCRVYKNKFTKGWQELNQVYHAMCDSADSLSRIKLASYLGSMIMIIEIIIFFVLTLWAAIKSVGLYQTCISVYVGAVCIQLTTLLPYVISSLFFMTSLLIRAHFLKIAQMITTLVEREKSSKSGRLASQIDCMRVLHEQLCSAVKHFEFFFGIQVLLTLCTSTFTIVIGAYAWIIQGEGISSQNSEEVSSAWGTQLYCAIVFVLLILVSGQLVENSANASAPVLNALVLTELDEPSQRQVTAFLHKVSAFPMKMSAVNITNISTTFLASAATNITTYLLVLMQFKLTVENKGAAAAAAAAAGSSSVEFLASDGPNNMSGANSVVANMSALFN